MRDDAFKSHDVCLNDESCCRRGDRFDSPQPVQPAGCARLGSR